MQSFLMSHETLEIIVKLFLFFFSIFHKAIAKVFLFILYEISFQLKNNGNKCRGLPEPQKVILKGKKR